LTAFIILRINKNEGKALDRMTFQKGDKHWKLRRSYRDRGNPNYGKQHSEKTKKLISEANTKLRIKRDYLEELYWEEELSASQIGNKLGVNAETIRLKMKSFDIKRRPPSKGNLGKTFSKRHKKRISQTRIERGLSKGNKNPMSDPDIIRKYFKSLQRRPTNPENQLKDLIKKHNLPFVYNGNKGDLIIGRRVPDFYNNNGRKHVIEVFGEVFHNQSKSFFDVPFRRTEKGTVQHYTKYGYHCTVIWDNELKNEETVVERIREFNK
jgi:G:T-mismatch repair DNA endonuclease (very short patch repair protein)